MHRCNMLAFVAVTTVLLQLLACTSAASEGSGSHRRELRVAAKSSRSLELPELQRQDIHSASATAAASIQIVTRQALLDYATQQGLVLLKQKVQLLALPDVYKTFHIPIIGDIDIRLNNLKIDSFSLPNEDGAYLVILDNYFNLMVSQVSCQLSFTWHWEKPALGIEGTGDGTLSLSNGVINYVFDVVKDGQSARPKLEVRMVDSSFQSTELKIHSMSADWLYQAVLTMFNDRIVRAIRAGIAGALSDDVPNAVNDVLSSLPTKIEIQGLPFSTSFDYSLYTLNYVLLKGFGEVEVGSGDKAMQRCPFEASDLPLGSDAIASDPAMLSLYLHESLVNCMAWGTFNGGVLQYSIVDGTIPNLHLTTDLLASLIPQLPKTYPHMMLRIDVAALAAPQVSFQAETGITLQASYSTSIYVNNETLGVPLVAKLNCNLTVTGLVSWDSTSIQSVAAHHSVVQSSMPVSTPQWDNTVMWFVQNYAGLFPMQQLVNMFVDTPVTSLVTLVNGQGRTLEGWFALSGDIQLQIPEAVAGEAVLAVA